MISMVTLLSIELCSITNREAFAMKLLSYAMLLAGKWYSFLFVDGKAFFTHPLIQLTGLFCTIAVIIFGIRGDDRDWMPDAEHNLLSWSFALAVVGCFCHWISGVLFLIESRILFRREAREKQRRNSYPMNETF